MMIPYIITGILCPIVGWLTDKFGKRLHLLFVAIIILMIFFIFFYILPEGPHNTIIAVIPLVLFGVFNGIFESTIWPLYPVIIEERVLGIGLAGTSIMNNILMAIVPQINGYLHDKESTKTHDDYQLVLLFMLFLACGGMFLVLWLYIEDGGKRGILSQK